MSKVTLEQRIARLERLLNRKINKSSKFEDFHSDVLRDLMVVFEKYFASPDNYKSNREFESEMEEMVNGDNDAMIDDVIQCLCDEFGYDPDSLEDVYDDIIDSLSQMAKDALYSIGPHARWADYHGFDDDYFL